MIESQIGVRMLFHKFSNRYPYVFPSATELLRWLLRRHIRRLPKKPERDLSPVQPELSLFEEEKEATLFFWIGHSTALLRMEGVFVLTDPHFSKYSSPVPGFGPRRWQEPGIFLEDLPHVDLVFISHNHYDHLDFPSVRALARRFPEVLFLVPKGLEKWFARFVPRARVKAMLWDETIRFKELEVMFTAVQHWSRRGLLDRNTSLWGGFVVQSERERFFFAGDLGYSRDLADIGKTYGPFDLCAIPIGPYLPRTVMKSNHLNPEEALFCHRDLRARHSVGVHWGTFHGISDEPLDQTPKDFAFAREKLGIPEEEFFLLPHGGHVLLRDGKIRRSACPEEDGKSIPEPRQDNREEPPARAG